MSKALEGSLSTVAKGAGIIFVGMIIGNILGILTQVLMGRILGPADFGLFNLGISIIMIFCVIPHFGLGSALTQFVPYNIKKRRYDKVKAGIDFSFKFCLILGIIAATVLFLLSDIISTKIFHVTELGIVIKVLCLALPFWAFHNTSGSLIQAFKKPKYFLYIENIGMKIVQVITFLILFFLGFRLFGALVAFICAAIFASISYIYVFYTRLSPFSNNSVFKSKQKNTYVSKELILLSWPLFLAGFTFLFMGYTDKILIGIYLNQVDVGIYSAAFTIASIMLFVFTSFSFNFRPLVAEYFATKDISSIQKLFSSITKWIFLLLVPLLIYLIFYAEEVILLIYGESYTSGFLALIILSAGIAMNGFTGLTGEVLIGIKKTKLNLWSEIIGAITNVGLNLILIPKFGIIGAAIGTSASISLKNLSSLIFVYKELKIQPYNLNFIKIFIASIIPMVILSLIFKTYFVNFGFLFIIPLFFIIYFAFLLTLHCFDEFDMALIRTFFKKIRLLK